MDLKCRDCKECNGLVCKGEIPGVGGKGRGLSFIRNVSKIKDITLNLDLLCNIKEIDTKTKLFNKPVAFPIYIAPIAGIKVNYGSPMTDVQYTKELLLASKELNTIVFTGDGIDIQNNFIDMVSLANTLKIESIPTMKPWIKEGIDIRVNNIKDYKYLAIAMDVDAAGLPLLKGNPIKVEGKSIDDLKQLKDCFKVPFIIKGVMTKQGALKAIEAQADAIVVSNHGGRVLDEALSTIEALKEIAPICKDKITVLVDGGFRSGYDIFKALALGADGVLIGRPVALSCINNSKDGVIEYFNKLVVELKDAMFMCGVDKIDDIDIRHINVHF